MTVIHSVLSGLLLLVLAFWGRVFFARLQQEWLLLRAGAAVERAEERGLSLAPVGLRSRLVVSGEVDGRPVRLEWRTGLSGPHCVVVRGAQRLSARRVLPLLCTGEELDRALDETAGLA